MDVNVEKFFPVSVDDFFDNPDIIVRYAKSLPKKSDPEGRWPGKRTELLWKINKQLNDLILLKILKCYYDLDYQSVFWERGNLAFQEISAFSKNKNDVRNKGWIHSDSDDQKKFPYELAGLIYLTPDIDPDAGTSLFTLKKRKDKEYKVENKQIEKNILFKDSLVDKALYSKKMKEQEEFFIEKTRFANIYNRMIMYDANEFHRANSFYSGDEKNPRLTLAFFIGGLNAGIYPSDVFATITNLAFPLEKIKNKKHDDFIECLSIPKQDD